VEAALTAWIRAVKVSAREKSHFWIQQGEEDFVPNRVLLKAGEGFPQ
jgi:hypothetical protein